MKESYLAACAYFATEKWEFEGALERRTHPEHFDILIFLEGHGQIRCGDEQFAYRPTEVWMLPARLGEYQLEPANPTSLLRTYVPPNLKEWVTGLASHGVAKAELMRVLHP